MKDIPGFKTFFLNDLLKRGEQTLLKAADKDYSKLDLISLRTLRIATEGTKALDPLNLIYFNKLIVDLEYIEESERSKYAKSFFDLNLGFSLILR